FLTRSNWFSKNSAWRLKISFSASGDTLAPPESGYPAGTQPAAPTKPNGRHQPQPRPRPQPQLALGPGFTYPGATKPAQKPKPRPVIGPRPFGPVPSPLGIKRHLLHFCPS